MNPPLNPSPESIFTDTTYDTDWGAAECSACEKGEKRNLVTAGCTKCSAGEFALNGNTAYTCTPCLAGQYNNDLELVVKDKCLACAAGKVQSATGKGSCDKCDGTAASGVGGAMGFQASTGQATCNTCQTYTKPTSNSDEYV